MINIKLLYGSNQSLQRFYIMLNKILFFIALTFLCFVAGGISVYYKKFPYTLIHEAVLYQQAHQQKESAFADAKKSTFFKKEAKSVTTNSQSAYQGYTIYSPHRALAVVIDNEGNELHKWAMPFYQAWHNDIQHLKNPLPESFILWFGFHVYPNGDLLVNYHARSDTPYGYGLIKLDKDSNILWKISDHIHHTLEVQPNGNIYALAQRVKKPDDLGLTFHDSIIQEDYFVILGNDGKELKRISLLRALANSSYKSQLTKHVSKAVWKADIMHANSLMMLSDKLAPLFPSLQAGNVLISMPTMNALGILDIDKEIFTWFRQGPWEFQHDAQFTERGTVIVFDNRGTRKKQSRILEYDFKTDKVTTYFLGSEKTKFYAEFIGGQQILPNSNLLVISGMEGRIFEVSAKGELVWSFHNPYYDKSYLKAKQPLPIVFARKYAHEDLPFLQIKN